MWDTTSIADGRQDSRGFLDGSGWTVSTGSATRATGATQTKAADPFGSSAALGSVNLAGMGAGAGGLSLSPTMLLIAGGAVLLIVLLKRKKG